MILAKILFVLFVVFAIASLMCILYVHSKYENIILKDVKPGDRIDVLTDDGLNTYTINFACDTMMTISYDLMSKTYECSWGDFYRIVGCKTLCEKYKKTYNKIDSLIVE